MKTRNLLSALMIMLAMSLGMSTITFAQPHHHRPHWVDVHCCDVSTRYVFFPENNFYYDLEREVYIYPSGGVWISSYTLPAMYAAIDLAFVPIIELDIRIERPFLHNHDHLVWYRTYHHDYDYVRYYRGHGHGGHYAHHRHYDRHGHRYSNRHDNGNHYGHYKGNDNHNKGGHGNNGHGNNGHGKGNHKNYEKKGNTYANRDYEHRGSGSGNDRKGNSRSGNGRGR